MNNSVGYFFIFKHKIKKKLIRDPFNAESNLLREIGGAARNIKVRRAYLNMSEELGKRMKFLPHHLRTDYVVGSEGEMSDEVEGTKTRGKIARAKQVAAAKVPVEGRSGGGGGGGGEGKRRHTQIDQSNQNSVNDSDSSEDDSDIENESGSEDDFNSELNEMDDRIKHNLGRTELISENCLILFNMFFNLLPDKDIMVIDKATANVDSDDHQWVKHLVQNEIKERKRPVSNLKGNTEVSANAEAPRTEPKSWAAAAATAAAATTDATPSNTNIDDGNSDTSVNITSTDQDKLIKQKVDEQLQAKLEDIGRKKNIIIAGMIEGVFDDWDLITSMFWEMNLGHLIPCIESQPTRLGVSHKNGKIRPIRVNLSNERAVDQIMKRKYDLQYSNKFWRVYINNDLSKDEREY